MDRDLDIPLSDEAEDIGLPEKQQILLTFIRDTGAGDTDAARAVGVNRSTLYRWRQVEPFASQYREARKIGVDHLIAEAERRAMRGSDRLLEFLLCNYAPERFRKREQLDLGNADGKPLQVTDSEAATRIAAMLAAARERKRIDDAAADLV